MTKLIRKERNIYYEYYEVELTQEQEKLYKEDREKFMDEVLYSESVQFDDSYEKKYIDTTNTLYYLDSEQEELFNVE